MELLIHYRNKLNDVRENDFPSELQSLVSGHESCYLDYMGAGVALPSQKRAMLAPQMDSFLANPHSAHVFAEKSHRAIEEARFKILKFFEVTSSEYDVVFTSGCTGALSCVVENFDFSQQGSSYSVHEFAHNSLLGLREVATVNGATFSRFLDEQDFNQLPCQTQRGKHLVAFPYECNFSGTVFPVHKWVETLKKRYENTFVLVDAAACVGKRPIHLANSGIDYFAFSFYKMLGLPSGIGCLLVRKSGGAPEALVPKKFAGGTVEFVVPGKTGDGSYLLRKNSIHARLEGGTPNFASIEMLGRGIDHVSNCFIGPNEESGTMMVCCWINHLRRILHDRLRSLRHYNGTPLVVLHNFVHEDDAYASPSRGICEDENQRSEVDVGSSVALSLVEADGSPIGHALVEKLANVEGIMLRTGCFCNPGACQYFLQLSDEDITSFASKGHVCWDEHDIVDGKATGCVRVSLGMYTTERDVLRFADFVSHNFARSSATTRFIEKYRHRVDSGTSTPAQTPQEVMTPMYDDYDFTAASVYSNDEMKDASLRARVSDIFLYPIKGCEGVSVIEWGLTKEGLLFDREWMLVEESTNSAVTPKKNVNLSKLKIQLSLTGNHLVVVNSDDQSRISVGLYEQELSAHSHIHRTLESHEGGAPLFIRTKKVEEYRVYDREVDNWFSRVLNQRVRLVRKAKTSEGHFANSGSLLIVHSSSHQKVLASMPAQARSDVSIRSYRPNIVLAGPVGTKKVNKSFVGLDESTDGGVTPLSQQEEEDAHLFVEQRWDSLTIQVENDGNENAPGQVELFSVGPCHRCQQVGFREDGTFDSEPLATISSLCRQHNLSEKKNEIVFGQLFDVLDLQKTLLSSSFVLRRDPSTPHGVDEGFAPISRKPSLSSEMFSMLHVTDVRTPTISSPRNTEEPRQSTSADFGLMVRAVQASCFLSSIYCWGKAQGRISKAMTATFGLISVVVPTLYAQFMSQVEEPATLDSTDVDSGENATSKSLIHAIQSSQIVWIRVGALAEAEVKPVESPIGE